MAEARSARTLGDRLASRRRARFVGRESEIELFRSALAAAEPPFSMLHIHGPGGIGKTSLLDVFGVLAAESGATVATLDARHLVPSPAGVLDALRRTVDVPDGDAGIHAPPGATPLVVLIDGYERLGPVDDWIRAHLMPRLPASTITVAAGRHPPSPAWRSDPAWHDLLRVVSLRNLDPQHSRLYLQACGVDPARHDRLVELSHGHPLGLSLLADVVGRGGNPGADPLTPDLVGTLLGQFLDVVPSSIHRRALEVCAISRVTTEDVLRSALGVDDVHGIFTWLRDLSFIEAGPDGLYPHDLARDALEADLRWRDGEGYRSTFRAVRAHLHRLLPALTGREQLRALYDEKFLFRHTRGILSPVDWDTWGRFYPEPASPGDRDTIVHLVRAAEGEESAAIARRWWNSQPEGFFVVRHHDDTIRGVITLLDLTRAGSEDIDADPGARTAWHHAHQHTPPRADDVVTQCRFVVDREAYQGPSPTLNATSVLTIQNCLRLQRPSWDFLTLAAPEQWDDYFAVADIPRVAGADVMIGGRRYGLFAHDFRRRPVDAWLELVTERALHQEGRPPDVDAGRPDALVLSRPEFEAAVRQALRDFHRPDLLTRNPLVRTRLVSDRTDAEEPPAMVLHVLVRAAVETLRDHPADDKLHRAVDRTYLHPAATHERAAAALDLPFSTYRRHLSRGVDRVVSWLWDQEVYGPMSATGHN